jgi:hypothetical protein
MFGSCRRDRVSSVLIPVGLVAVGATFLVRGLMHMYTGEHERGIWRAFRTVFQISNQQGAAVRQETPARMARCLLALPFSLEALQCALPPRPSCPRLAWCCTLYCAGTGKIE